MTIARCHHAGNAVLCRAQHCSLPKVKEIPERSRKVSSTWLKPPTKWASVYIYWVSVYRNIHLISSNYIIDILYILILDIIYIYIGPVSGGPPLPHPEMGMIPRCILWSYIYIYKTIQVYVCIYMCMSMYPPLGIVGRGCWGWGVVGWAMNTRHGTTYKYIYI